MKLIQKITSGITTLVLSVVIMTNGFTAYAAEESKLQTLTVDQATANAIAASSTIRNLEDSYTVSDEELAKLKDSLWDATDYSTLLSISTKIMQAEASQAANSKDQLLQKEKLKVSIMDFFAAVIDAENALKLYDQNIEIMEKQLTIAKVNVSLGNISEIAYTEQKSNYDKTVSGRPEKQSAIDSAYASLNQVMNRNLKTRYNLVLDLEYKEAGQLNAVTLAADAISQSNTVKSKEDNIKIAQYKLDTYEEVYDISGKVTNSTSRESLEIDLQKAYRDLNDTKSNLEKTALTLCNTVLSQEISYKSLIADLDVMKKQLVVKEKQYELGKITELSLKSFQYDIAKQKESIRSLTCKHAINMMKVKNTALLS